MIPDKPEVTRWLEAELIWQKAKENDLKVDVGNSKINKNREIDGENRKVNNKQGILKI